VKGLLIMQRILLWCMLLLAAVAVHAADAYLVRFAADGRSSTCASAFWADDILLYNNQATPATVRLLGLSNGTIRPETPREVTVLPHRVFSIAQAFRARVVWAPLETSPIWVVHLDIPDGITIDSRDEVYYEFACGTLPEHDRRSAGKVSLPVFRALVPAGQPQIKLGTDLGGRSGRMNVAIYNAGENAATAHVDVRNACDDAVVDSRDVGIPANTILQFGGFRTFGPDCTTTDAASWMRYTIITVDQPSISYVSNLTDDLPPVDIVPPIGLAVSVNTEY